MGGGEVRDLARLIRLVGLLLVHRPQEECGGEDGGQGQGSTLNAVATIPAATDIANG
jgi:hypothetical protein